MYDLYSKFDIQQHKEHYVNYLEVIIYPNGEVEYAVPSHQEKLIRIACEQLRISRQKLYNSCPDEYVDVIVWLCNITDCISVWNDYCITKDTAPITSEQKQKLRELKENGLYYGTI